MKHQEIKQLLPEIFQRTDQEGSPLYGLLEVMQAMTEPAEKTLQEVPKYFDPYSTPERFLPFLASWVDLDRYFPAYSDQLKDLNTIHLLDAGHLRELIVAAPQLSKLRGTKSGMELFLKTATGIKNYKIEESITNKNRTSRPFHIKITAPNKAQKYRKLIENIIEQEKPAYVTYELKFSP